MSSSTDQRYLKKRYLTRVKQTLGPILYTRFQQFAKEALEKREKPNDFAKPIKLYMDMVPEWNDAIYQAEKKMLFSLKTKNGKRYPLLEYINNIVQAELNLISSSSVPLGSEFKHDLDLCQWVRELYAYCASEFNRHPTWLYSKNLRIAKGDNRIHGIKTCHDAIENACDMITPVDEIMEEFGASEDDYDSGTTSTDSESEEDEQQEEVEDPIEPRRSGKARAKTKPRGSKGNKKSVVVKQPTRKRVFTRNVYSDDDSFSDY